jgi:phage recombination protein Bet
MNSIVRSEPLKDEQIELIKRTVANGATDNELKLFLYQCERTGLDPLAKQIYSIKRSGKMVTQIGIDGARLVAQRTGRYAGQDGPYWCGEDGQWVDVWLSNQPPRAAKVNVYLMGVLRGTPGVAHWDEYCPKVNGQVPDMWKRMPALMLAKCAEMLALRKAFPQELSGLYTAEEMSQADNVVDATFTVAAQESPQRALPSVPVESTNGARKTPVRPSTSVEDDVTFSKDNTALPTDEELEIMAKWQTPDDAKTWAVETGACLNIFEARNSFKNTVDEHGGKLTKANIAAVYLAFVRKQLAKVQHKEAA